MLSKLPVLRLWVTALCALLFSTVIFAQQKTITGKILGEDGVPIPGVTVLAKGTTVSTVTNSEGNFSIALPS
ncbi:MAG TPA: carboxypeptidase regulatory-like domain-containing protein, partial [Flavisolibacter sp.]|nr:carboxypeptidase regulatory-like domain-containing protein [Flavisolibacter sp.]